MTTREKYLKALDIDDFLYLENNNIKETTIKCLIIEPIMQNSFCDKSQSYDLLKKMLSAIDIKIQDVICMQATNETLEQLITKNKTKCILVMGDLIKLDIKNIFYTYHPQEVIANAKLKRDVWNVLKNLQKCLI